MWPYRVGLLLPPFRENFGFQQRIEDLPIQQFVSHFSIEGFNEACLPGTTSFDEQRVDADLTQRTRTLIAASSALLSDRM